jgi:hypothetical protein
VVNRCTNTAVSDDNSRDMAHCYLPKQQRLSNHFCILFVHLQMLRDEQIFLTYMIPKLTALAVYLYT